MKTALFRYGAAVAAVVVPMAAHDMWIEPTTFFPAAGQVVGTRLLVGENLLGDPLARRTPLVREFVVEGPSGRKPVTGQDGADPAGHLRVDSPGLLVVGYFSNPSPVEMPGEKFNQYLKEEGLEAIAALRAGRNQSGAGVREIFSRCAKSLVISGTPSDRQGDRQLGFPLELVAERNPYMLRSGADLPVKLTYQNRPLQGALVVAIHRLNHSEKLSARTDAEGRVRFRVRAAGMWMIKAVHMVPAPAGVNADWASYWASLTFELRNAAIARK